MVTVGFCKSTIHDLLYKYCLLCLVWFNLVSFPAYGNTLVKFCFIPIHCRGCLVTESAALFSVLLYLFSCNCFYPSGLSFVYLSVRVHIALGLSSGYLFSFFIFYALTWTLMTFVHSIFSSTVSFNFIFTFFFNKFFYLQMCNVLVWVIPLCVCFLILSVALMLLCLLFHAHISAPYAITG